MKDIARKVSIDETTNFDKVGFSGQVYVQNEEKVGFNALLVTVTGHHPKKKMVDTTRNYYVIEGEGSFTLDGVSHKVRVGDLFIVGAGHEYEYEGTMKLFEFNVSAENSFKDETLQ